MALERPRANATIHPYMLNLKLVSVSVICCCLSYVKCLCLLNTDWFQNKVECQNKNQVNQM